MQRPVRLVSVVLVLLACAACGENRYAPGAAELGPEHYVIAPDDVPEPGRHIRYARPEEGRSGGLDIAVTEFRSKDGLSPVVLVGAVHVADAPFFDAVQRELDQDAVVLYEGVKPEQMNAADWQAQVGEKGGETAELQRALAGWFGLEYQLAGIDYRRPHFVHADMTLEQFLAEGGAELVPVAPQPAEPVATGPDASGTVVAAAPPSHGNLGAEAWQTWQAVREFGDMALGRPGPLRSLARRMFAETLGTVDMGKALAMRPGFTDLILMKRNEVVMQKLAEVLPTATGPIAIFYGAAHMPDLEARLTRDMGYTRTRAHWLRAWAVRAPLAR